MAKVSEELKRNLNSILKDDFEGCQFFMAAAQLLTNKMIDLSASLDNEDFDFDALRDAICEIGPFINNVEHRLLDVEECYTRLVEALSIEKSKQ